MDDRTLVAALVAGDQRGLDGTYRRYADRLFTYCRSMLRDPDSAADAVHDTFVIASQRADQLREPDRLRPWLYAIARNECLRLLRGRARQVPVAEVEEMGASEEDPVAGVREAEVQELVWAAADGLNQGDREVFELSIRHDLPAPEVSALLGVSVAHAHARLSRARAQLERSLGALLVARTGQRDCPELAGLLDGWDGRLTALLRKRVSRHIEGCETCAERQRQQLRPAALFPAYAAAPWLIVPGQLWPRLERTSFQPEAAQLRESLAARAGPAGQDGFPRPLDAVRRRRTALAGSSAAALALLLTTAGLWPLVGVDADQPLAAPGGSPTAAAAAPPPVTSEPAPTSPAADPEPTRTPAADAPAPASPPVVAPPPAEPPPPASPTAPAAEPLTVIATGSMECFRGRYRLTVTARASAPLAEAVLVISDSAGVPQESALVVDGQGASGRGLPERTPLTWEVVVTGADGQTARTEPATVGLYFCPPTR